MLRDKFSFNIIPLEGLVWGWKVAEWVSKLVQWHSIIEDFMTPRSAWKKMEKLALLQEIHPDTIGLGNMMYTLFTTERNIELLEFPPLNLTDGVEVMKFELARRYVMGFPGRFGFVQRFAHVPNLEPMIEDRFKDVFDEFYLLRNTIHPSYNLRAIEEAFYLDNTTFAQRASGQIGYDVPIKVSYKRYEHYAPENICVTFTEDGPQFGELVMYYREHGKEVLRRATDKVYKHFPTFTGYFWPFITEVGNYVRALIQLVTLLRKSLLIYSIADLKWASTHHNETAALV
jgi:hypothetical protein